MRPDASQLKDIANAIDARDKARDEANRLIRQANACRKAWDEALTAAKNAARRCSDAEGAINGLVRYEALDYLETLL